MNQLYAKREHTQAHFVAQNTVGFVPMQRDQPIETVYLIVAHLTVDEVGCFVEDRMMPCL